MLPIEREPRAARPPSSAISSQAQERCRCRATHEARCGLSIPTKPRSNRQLIAIDRDGNETVLLDERLGYGAPADAPDRRRLAVAIETESEADIAIYDFARRTLTPVTFEGWNVQAVWSPDGSRIAFASDRDSVFNLYARAADGSGSVERLTTSDSNQTACARAAPPRHQLIRRAPRARPWRLALVIATLQELLHLVVITEERYVELGYC